MRISEALRGVALPGVETSPFIYFVELSHIHVRRDGQKGGVIVP